MKSILLFFMFILLIFSLYNCNQRHYTSSTLPEEQLIFGDGGGFTGAVTEYMLLKNGQLFRVNGMQGDTTEVAKIEKSAAKQLLQEAEALQLEKMDIQKPGNMYYFVGVRDKDETHKITWGDSSYTIAPTVQSFYKKLMETVRQAKAPEK